jgi:hypothetical protein
VSAFSQPFDPSFLGTDLATTAQGDVAASGSDWGTISGIENVVNAFIRELVTPLGYLGRYIYDIDGLKVIDEDYGNNAYAQLSEPMTPAWINNMVDHIHSVAANQPRIQLQTVDYTITNLEQQGIHFEIKFTILNVPQPLNLILKRSNNALTAGLAPAA